MEIRKHRIEALDGLRFFAFIMVMFYHYLFIAPLQGFIPREYAIDAFSFGDFGVDLFFLISGFVITLSSENRTPKKFIIARFNRIFPLFVICALIIFFFSISLPMVDPKERFISLVYSLSFYPGVFGKDYFSSVYWTIAVEVTFYIWVFILMKLRLWNNFRNEICFAWLALSLLNNFIIHNNLISTIFITHFAGHFVIGVVIFELRTSKIQPKHSLLILISSIFIYNNMIGHQKWIDSFGVSYDHASLLFMTFFIIALVWITSHVESLGKYYNSIKMLGAMTYPLYLVHADLGFWSHAIFERKIWSIFPITKQYVGYHLMVFIAIILSFLTSYLLVKYIDPPMQKLLKKWQS